MTKEFYINKEKYILLKNLNSSREKEVNLIKKLNSNDLFIYKKLEAEIFDFELHSYKSLKKLGINIPNLIFADKENKIILRDYIQGENSQELIKSKKLSKQNLMEIFLISENVNINNFNIDYKAKNFIIENNKLIYLKYAIYPYDELFNFNNYGVYFWIDKYQEIYNFEASSFKKEEIIKEMYYDYINWKHSKRN